MTNSVETSELGARPMLLSARSIAELLDMSVSSWHRLVAAGKTPRPIKLNGSTRWRANDLETWVALGCPIRDTFEELMENDDH